MRQIQQGDVLLFAVDELPIGARALPKEGGWHVLARGEATGHAHAVAGAGSALYEKDGVLYLHVTKAEPLTHEEHAPVTLTPGVWQIGQVRELDMLEGYSRRVAD